MKRIDKYILPFVCLVTMLFSACQDQRWDEHIKSSDDEVGVGLLEALQANSECSRFYEAVMKAGDHYVDLLSQGNNFTVFVPVNDAWQGVDMNNETELRRIVAYHIAYGRLLSSSQELKEPIQMVNSKMVRYDSDSETFNGVKITSADHPAGNGVFHITDKIMDLKLNIWDYIVANFVDYQQIEYINSLDSLVMDTEKSISTGIDYMGQLVYDDEELVVWKNVNDFLETVPIDREDLLFTYIVVKDEGFDLLYNKYHRYFESSTPKATDSITRFNICQDFVFQGIVDITQQDTLTNVFGVKVPVRDVVIEERYDASNGRVYVIDKSNILLREKIKPVIIEGEDFIRSADNHCVFVRNKPLASGLKDMVLSCRLGQTDTFRYVLTDIHGNDSVYGTYTRTRNFDEIGGRGANNSVFSNITNFWIEYKAQVFSANYEIHYVAFNDLSYHIDRPVNNPNPNPDSLDVTPRTQTLRFDQKLFVSMPGDMLLNRHSSGRIENNYLGDFRCFVSQDTASYIPKEKIMRQWYLQQPEDYSGGGYNENNQFLCDIRGPVDDTDAPTIMTVSRTGMLTMWLCNTARTAAANSQGPLFLDYIKLVPVLPEE